jgi:hypothetical protein
VNLAELVESLAVQTVDTGKTPLEEGRYGPSLLQQLRDARFSSNGGSTSGATAAAARAALNMNAHILWEDITGQIAALWVAASDMKPHRAPEVDMLAWWGIFAAAQARSETVLIQHEIAAERLEKWATDIRRLIDPPKSASLRDVACPQCGMSRALFREGGLLPGDRELEVESDALQVSFPERDGIMVECASCGVRWVGDTQVIHLGRVTGVDVDVIADAIREAQRPAEAVVWEPGGKSEEALDLSRPEHEVLIQGGK